MNPKEYKQMMDYLVAPKKKRTFKPLIPDLEKTIDLYDGPVMVDGDEIKFENQKRAELAKAGDKEGAAGKAAQAKRLYDAQARKRLKETEERMKDRMIQWTKDHDQQLQGKQPI